MEIGTIIKEMLTPELLPLVIVLYLIGLMLKNTEKVPDKMIPVWLGIISILCNTLYVVSTNTALFVTPLTAAVICSAILTILMQGVLFAGAAVYANQIYKQLSANG